MAGFDNDVMYAANVDFRGVEPVAGQVVADGQLLIGSTASPNIKVGIPTSTDGSITITPGSGTLNFATTGGQPSTKFDVDAHTAPGTDPVVPTALGVVSITGAQTAPGTIANVIQTDSLAANAYTIEIQQTSAVAAKDVTKNGVAHFNSNQFSNDQGFISLAGGGQAIDSIAVQTGTSPITPTAAGLVTISGATVAPGTNPVRTDGTGANTMAVEVQISQAIAATDATKIGLSNFDSAAFDVDANGFVQLNGGGIAATNFTVDANTAPGTNPVVPSATGNIVITGNQVAAGTVGADVIRTDSLAANAYTIEIQRSTAVAASASLNNGVAHYNNSFFVVDSNGFVSDIGISPQTVKNLGIKYTVGTGTFSITDENGNALSSTNPASITIPSKATPGTYKTFLITTAYSFIDANGASQIIGNLFGLTTGIATDQDIPFFIYFVLNAAETAVTPMISRDPGGIISNAAANIGKASSAVANTNLSFWALDNTITVADYALNPTVRVGLFRMRMSAANDWTVQTLTYSSTQLDGINVRLPDKDWNMPTGQFGAAAGRLMYNNGGTTPGWTDQRITYKFIKDRSILVRYYFSGDNGTPGVGAVLMIMSIPFFSNSVFITGGDTFEGSWYGAAGALTARIGIHEVIYNANGTYFLDYIGGALLNGFFSAGARSLRGSFFYTAGGT